MRTTSGHPVDDDDNGGEGDVECAVVAAVSAAPTVRVSNKLAFPATEVRTKIEAGVSWPSLSGIIRLIVLVSLCKDVSCSVLPCRLSCDPVKQNGIL